jgi:hypothetical protein
MQSSSPASIGSDFGTHLEVPPDQYYRTRVLHETAIVGGREHGHEAAARKALKAVHDGLMSPQNEVDPIVPAEFEDLQRHGVNCGERRACSPKP